MNLEVGKEYPTRSGDVAKIVHENPDPDLFGRRFIGVIRAANGNGYPATWRADGHVVLDRESPFDLVEPAVPPNWVWLNVFPDYVTLAPTRRIADEWATATERSGRIKLNIVALQGVFDE